MNTLSTLLNYFSYTTSLYYGPADPFTGKEEGYLAHDLLLGEVPEELVPAARRTQQAVDLANANTAKYNELFRLQAGRRIWGGKIKRGEREDRDAALAALRSEYTRLESMAKNTWAAFDAAIRALCPDLKKNGNDRLILRGDRFGLNRFPRTWIGGIEVFPECPLALRRDALMAM